MQTVVLFQFLKGNLSLLLTWYFIMKCEYKIFLSCTFLLILSFIILHLSHNVKKHIICFTFLTSIQSLPLWCTPPPSLFPSLSLSLSLSHMLATFSSIFRPWQIYLKGISNTNLDSSWFPKHIQYNIMHMITDRLTHVQPMVIMSILTGKDLSSDYVLLSWPGVHILESH